MANPSPRTVLYIDDDPDDQEFFITGLAESRPDVKCFVANDSKSALEMIDKIPLPNFIFIDLHLPKVSGIELLKKFKTITAFSTIPTYILSTSLFEPHAVAIKEMGGSGFLRKPATLQDFKLMFDEVLS